MMRRKAMSGLVVVLLGAACAWGDAGAAGFGSGTATVARIGAVRAVGEDLVVRVVWSEREALPTTADIRALDGEGLASAERAVVPLPGAEAEVTLDRALVGVGTRGFQLMVEVAGPGGAELAVPRPVRVAYRCNEDDVCAFETTAGLRAGAVAIDRRLAEALDVQEASGSLDLLGDAVAADSSLAGSVFTLASQLGPVAPAAGKGNPGCFCFWEASSSRSPAEMTWVHQHSGSWEELGWSGPGVGVGLGFQKRAAQPAASRSYSGASAVGLALRCWEIDVWSSSTIQFAEDTGDPTPRVIDVPRARSCTRDCADASVFIGAELSAFVEIGAVGNGSAETTMRVDATIEDPSGRTTDRVLDLQATESDIPLGRNKLGLADWGCAGIPSPCSRTVSGGQASMRIKSTAAIDVPVTSDGAGDVWGYASARLLFHQVRAVGTATCAVDSLGSVTLEGGVPAPSIEFCLGGTVPIPDNCGLVVDPWG